MSGTTQKTQEKEYRSTFFGIRFDDKYFIWVLLIVVSIQALFNTLGFFFFVLNFLADIFVLYFITGTFPVNIWELQTFPMFIFYIIIIIFMEVVRRNLKGKSRWYVRHFGNLLSVVLILALFVIPFLTNISNLF